MKLIHFSDTHLGFSDLDIVNDDGVNLREADFYDAFSQTIDAIIEKKPDFVIHTGDLFHRANPTNRAITFAILELKRLEKVKIPLIIIAGNHSTPKTFSSSPILKVLKSLENVYPIFSQRYEKIEFENIIFHAIPHINDENLISDELEKIEKEINKNKKNILMLHCSVGSHYLMGEFGEWVYPKDKEYLFEMMDYVALGHWHGFGKVRGLNAYYSGSTERTSSSDKRNDKGFVEVDLDEKLKVTHHTLKLRKSLLFEIDTTNFDDEIKELNLDEIKDSLVEVVLKNLTPQKSLEITNQKIKEIFCEATYVRVKREFLVSEGDEIDENLEKISIEGYFLDFIKKSDEDEKSKKRLLEKAKELFFDNN